MTTEQINQLKFPIGPFKADPNLSKSELDEMTNTIASAPSEYRKVIKGLSEEDLRKTYRDGGWNVQQLVNHVADMHLLHFFRMKRALTEPDYKEVTLVNVDGWAATPDGLSASTEASLDMFESIGKRFVHLIQSLNEKQHEITYFHPLRKTTLNQKQAIAMSAWHVKHHLAHIKIALAR